MESSVGLNLMLETAAVCDDDECESFSGTLCSGDDYG